MSCSSAMQLAWSIWTFRSFVSFQILIFSMCLRLSFCLIPLVLFLLMLVNELSSHWGNSRSSNYTILQAWWILIMCIRHWCNRHSSTRPRNSIFDITSISSSNDRSMSTHDSTWSLGLGCCVLLVKSSLEITCEILTALVDVFVDNSSLVLMLSSIFVDISLTSLICSIC